MFQKHDVTNTYHNSAAVRDYDEELVSKRWRIHYSLLNIRAPRYFGVNFVNLSKIYVMKRLMSDGRGNIMIDRNPFNI